MKAADHTAPDGAFAGSEDHPVVFHEISCDDGAFLLRLNRSALSRLDVLVREGLNTVVGRYSVETGGVMIGDAAPDGSAVTLLDVVPVASEHRFGPSYRLSENDLRSFAETVAKYSTGTSKAIGYFRSHLQATVSSRIEDETLIRRFFPDGGCSVILVHADPNAKNTAWFYQWDGGDGVRLLDRFPLDTGAGPLEPDRQRRAPEPLPERPAPRAAGAAAVMERQPEDGAVSPVSEQNIPPPASFVPANPRFRKTLIATAAVLVPLAVFALGRLSAPFRSVPVSDSGLLDLTVEVHDPIAEVKWNPAGPALRDSERGSLDIVDGPEVSRIDLNQAQLRAGHYEYLAKQREFTCLMTVFRNNNAFVGAMQYVHMNVPPDTPEALLREPPVSRLPAAPDLPAVKSSPARRTDGETLRIGSSPADPDRAPSTAARSSKPRGASFRPPPAVVARPAPAPRLEDPPVLRTAVSGPAVSPLPASLLTSALQEVARSSPPPETFSEAVPITRARPAPAQVSALAIRREVLIRVTVRIDNQGRVTGAAPLDTTDLIERTLAPYAVQAAGLWRFNPARRNGVPVASETVVTFQFPRNL